MESGPHQLRDRLSRAAKASLVGREREQEQLRAWLKPAVGPAVVFISGPGGIGKSTLLRGVLGTTKLRGLVVEGHDAEPTPTGMLRSLGWALQHDAPSSPQDAAAALLAAGVDVLAFDGYERLNLVDGWLRNELVVELPASITTVLVGRRPPNLAWRVSPGWRPLLAELVVGPLTDKDATRLAERHALPQAITELVTRFGRGHPLALELAAEAFARHPHLEIRDAPPAEVVEELVEVLLDDLGDADREVVEAASVLRRITEPTLAAVLTADEDKTVDIRAAWRTLRSLPFVMTTPSGLRLQPVAHTTIADALEIRDLQRVQRLRRRAAEAALHAADDGRSWDATADLLFLVQNPIIRNSYVPPGFQQHPVERATSDDVAAILAITDTFDGPAAAEVMQRWWHAHRDHFVVGRGQDQQVTAFSVVVPLSAVDRELSRTDPVLRAFLDDVARRPLAEGEECLLHRRALGVRRGELQSPELGAMVVDLKRKYLELRSVLARTYAVAGDWTALGPLLRTMGFEPIEPPARVGEPSVLPCVLEFGTGHVDGWLMRHIQVENILYDPVESEPGPQLNATRERGVGRLSAREREVIIVLAEGLTNLEIAERLFISERTVNRHLSNIFAKLGVRNRTTAARMAVAAGLVG